MDSRVLELIFSNLKSKDEKWFRNLQRIVEKMGESAIPVLKARYDKEKN